MINKTKEKDKRRNKSNQIKYVTPDQKTNLLIKTKVKMKQFQNCLTKRLEIASLPLEKKKINQIK